MKKNRPGKQKPLSALAVLALVLSGLTGCAVTVPEEDVVILPFAAVGVVSFKPNPPEKPRTAQVNAQVARLLDAREQAEIQELVAAR